jgi:hypothetical protein
MGMERRNGYVLGFSPVDRRHDGHYHGVQIQIIQPVSLPPLRSGDRATARTEKRRQSEMVRPISISP